MKCLIFFLKGIMLYNPTKSDSSMSYLFQTVHMRRMNMKS